MRWMNSFIHALKGTFTSPAYYKKVVAAPFSFSLKFFYFFFFLYAFIATIFFTVKSAPGVEKFINNVPSAIIRAYPEELAVTINKGEVTTNVEEPYIIPISRVEKAFSDVLGETTATSLNLLVIDTNALIDNFKNYDTYALLTKNNLVYINDNGNIEVISLKDVDGVTINQELVLKAKKAAIPYLKYITPVLALSMFLGIFVLFTSFNLVYLLFFGLIALLIGKVMKYSLPYKKGYQLGLHLVVVYSTLMGVVYLALSSVEFSLNYPFQRTIVLIIMLIGILNKLSSKSPKA